MLLHPLEKKRRQVCRVALIFALLLSIRETGQAADAASVKSALTKGAGFLASQVGETQGGKRTLVVLALYKAGMKTSSRPIKETIDDIVKRCAGDKYQPAGEHIYEAGVEATLLADIDGEKYQQELTKLRDYIIGQQLETGAWDYPNGGHGKGSVGDTSVTQYACLGLWAAARAGIEVDPEVWMRVLAWHTRFQNPDGGFAYCPTLVAGEFGSNSTLNMTVAGVGNMHIAMLQIDPEFVPLRDEKPTKRTPNPSEKKEDAKFGILEKVQINTQPGRKLARVSDGSVDAVRRAFGWIGPRFRLENKPSPHNTYYYYTLERMGALAGVTQIGSHEWFNDCADYLIKNQTAKGSWDESSFFDEVYDTAFCVLFLTRSTGKLVHRTQTEPGFGAGTLAGGRGLPDDLSDVQFNGRQVMKKEKSAAPLDQLLASLQTSGDINIEDVQKQIVEKVQLGDRDKLIGQTDKLLKLVDHPSADVRQTVIWALGRSDQMELGSYLIDALDDPSLAVIIEARNALCWLSRKPTGFGEPEDPLAELPPDATAQQKRDAIAAWHKDLVLNWGQWYLDNRPFAQRGDAFEANLRLKIQYLKTGTVNQ